MRPRERPSSLWLVPVPALVLLCYVVPYTVLRGVDEWYGSLLFWSACTLVVITINVVVSSAWRN